MSRKLNSIGDRKKNKQKQTKKNIGGNQAQSGDQSSSGQMDQHGGYDYRSSDKFIRLISISNLSFQAVN